MVIAHVVVAGGAGGGVGGTTVQVSPAQAYSAFGVAATICSMFTGLVKKPKAQ